MKNDGERIATLEQLGRTHSDEILSLRETRHEHANDLMKLDGRVSATEKAVEDMEMRVVPAVRKTLEQQADEIVHINSRVSKTRLDFGWVMRILTVVLMFVVAIAQAVIIFRLNEASARAAQPPPAISAPAKTHT